MRWRLFIGLFMTFLFLQISIVTSINHYNPGLYLDLSLHWRRIPVLCFQLLLVLVVVGLPEILDGFRGICMEEEVMQSIVRSFVLPLMILNLVLQLGVVVDSYWGWRRVGRVVMTSMCRKNSVQLEHDPHQQPGEESPVRICNLSKVTSFLNR